MFIASYTKISLKRSKIWLEYRCHFLNSRCYIFKNMNEMYFYECLYIKIFLSQIKETSFEIRHTDFKDTFTKCAW